MSSPPRYRFGPAQDRTDCYSDGQQHPHRWQALERSLDEGQTWEVVGYAEIHTHRVKLDETDVEDVSFGFTARANPKRA